MLKESLGFSVFSEKQNKKEPYVVSADSQSLLQAWGEEKKISFPNNSYFAGMLKELENNLRQYFDQVEIVPEAFLRLGLNSFIQNSSIPHHITRSCLH